MAIMTRALALALLLTPAAVHAQAIPQSAPATDITSLQQQVAAASAKADAAKASADAAVKPADLNTAIANATPAPCTAPLADTFGGSAGTGSPCMTRPDATRPTQVQSGTAVTTTDGSFAGPWAAGTLTSAPQRGTATIYSTLNPYLCQLATMTTTGFTGKCWQLVSTTLPNLPASLLGLAVSPVANPAAGLTVNIFARQ